MGVAEVVGVRQQQERQRRHVLHVAPSRLEYQPTFFDSYPILHQLINSIHLPPQGQYYNSEDLETCARNIQ